VLGSLAQWLGPRPQSPNSAATADASGTATHAQKFKRWKKIMAMPYGWQYTIRLGSCLAVAGVLRTLWPQHHLYWIAMTIALLTQRQPEPHAAKTTQRALGTAIGVLLAGLLLAYQPPTGLLIAGIAVLGALRPLLKARNYLAYSVLSAPLIILLMEGGGRVYLGVLADRLNATVAGAILVVVANRLFSKLAVPPPGLKR
jgi:uncharacterized membrane protein YccC